MTELPPPPATPPNGPPGLRRFSRRPGPAAGPPAAGPPAAPPPAAQPEQSGGQPQPFGSQPGQPAGAGGYEWPAGGPTAPRRRRGMVLAPLATVVAVAAVAAGVVALRHDGATSEAALRPLVLTDAGRAEGGVAAQAPAVPVAAAGYRIEGTLPAGPARAAVRTSPPGQAPAAAVSELADALGLAGRPTRSSAGWTVNSGGRTLRVLDEPGWQWVYSSATDLPGGGMACDVIINGRPACLPGRVGPGGPIGGGKVIPIDPPAAGPGSAGGTGSSGTGSSGTGAGSGTGSGGGQLPGSVVVEPAPGAAAGSGQVPGSGPGIGSGTSGSGGAAPGNPAPDKPAPDDRATAVPVPMPVDPPQGPRPDEAAVRKAAADVLTALGLTGADLQFTGYPAVALVSAAPVVGGLPTWGLETRLQYDGRITLTGGSGWLAPSAAGAEYPLISAQRALDALPKPEIARFCPEPSPATCAVPQLVITGARLGLTLRHDQQAGALLVPAWLYTVQGGTMPLVALAVDPAYLHPATGPVPATESPDGATGAPGGPPIPMPKPTK